MVDSAAKRAWMKENKIIFTICFMRRTEADMIEFLDAQKAAGNDKGTVIKKALREYMERHGESKEYRYGMRLRGYSPGAQPKGTLRREDDTTGKYHDIIVYDRALSAKEIEEYELDEI